jgi:hypothetical protein
MAGEILPASLPKRSTRTLSATAHQRGMREIFKQLAYGEAVGVFRGRSAQFGASLEDIARPGSNATNFL